MKLQRLYETLRGSTSHTLRYSKLKLARSNTCCLQLAVKLLLSFGKHHRLSEHTHYRSVEAAAVRVPVDETPTHTADVELKPEQGKSVTLEFSDGSTATLDQPLLIGRRPSAPASLGGRPYRLITLSESGSGLSRTHVRIEPDGDGAIVTDLGSTNGTVLLSSDEVITLQPHEPQRALPGDQILLSENVAIRLTRSE